MKSNTIVLASDSNYVWGVFLLICSIRMNNMDEPVLILAKNYTPEDIECLQQFDDISIVEHTDDFGKNMNCIKPIAMLLAETEYMTWVDCDGLFTGNCSKYLVDNPEKVHFRLRSNDENYHVFEKHYRAEDGEKGIPKHILQIWQANVGENYEPLLETCGSTCFFSVHRNHRHLLEKWRDQIEKVLPHVCIGVCNSNSVAYFQTDESVLNSVLCFAKNVIKPGEYKLDKDNTAYYVHFTCHPKPWLCWTFSTIKHFDKTVELVQRAQEQGISLPRGGTVPFSFNSKFKIANHAISIFIPPLYRVYKKLERLLA